MSEQKKQQTKREELSKEELEKVAGGFEPIDGVVEPLPFNPVDGKV